MDISEMSAMLGYGQDDLADAPLESNMGLGCGNPIAIAALKEGETVLDLGSGGGLDCFLARRKVGETGHVIGVDMTPDMIKLARKNAEKSGYKNIEFRLGEIEHLPAADNSVDVIISNCVINLSLDKRQVFKDAFRVLKPGGRLSTSDVVAIAKIPESIVQDLALIAGCIGGAEHIDNLEAMLRDAGFTDIKLTPKDNSREIVKSWAPDLNIEDYVASYVIEAIKGKKIIANEPVAASESPMRTMSIYEPAMCCPTGICGADVDPELLRISTALETLAKRGIKVFRYNLTSAPDEFVNNRTINELLTDEGVEILPIVIVDGKIVITQRYPSDEEFTRLLGLSN